MPLLRIAKKDSQLGFKAHSYYFVRQTTMQIVRVLSEKCKLYLGSVRNQGNIILVPVFFIKAALEFNMGRSLIGF